MHKLVRRVLEFRRLEESSHDVRHSGQPSQCTLDCHLQLRRAFDCHLAHRVVLHVVPYLFVRIQLRRVPRQVVQLELNLTAAEYVFLLDPWWNPAVELQAIDRTHRIGQDKKVFAYRLIAKDTVEEKVLELQKAKRALAESIISADGSLIGELTPEDLDFLLS